MTEIFKDHLGALVAIIAFVVLLVIVLITFGVILAFNMVKFEQEEITDKGKPGGM